jgi:hypothetical protein
MKRPRFTYHRFLQSFNRHFGIGLDASSLEFHMIF